MMSDCHHSDLHSAPCQTSTAAWYVIHCQPRKDRYAAMVLQTQCRLTIYLPEVIDNHQGSIHYVPLFPCYLFAKIDLQLLPLSKINTTPGVVRLVMFGEHPQSVPDNTIRMLQQQVQRLNEQGGLPQATFQPGDRVQFKTGPLNGLEAIFMRPTTPGERALILLEFMGRLNEIEVEQRMLTASISESASRQPRRTRGKGRKINTYH